MTGVPAPSLVVCLGDSITGCRPGDPYRHQYLKWGDLLELMLEARLGIGRARVLNAGHAGDATFPRGDCPGAMARLGPQVLDVRPDLVLALLGANDLSPDALAEMGGDVCRAQSRLRDNLVAIGRAALSSGAAFCLLQYPLPRAATPATAWGHHALANEPIADAARVLGVPCIALEPAFEAAERGGIPREALADPVDGVHLRPEGERVVARTVFESLDAAGWSRAERPPSASRKEPAP